MKAILCASGESRRGPRVQISPSAPSLLFILRNSGVSKSNPRNPDDVITSVIDLMKLQVYKRRVKTTEKSATSSRAISIAVFLESLDEFSRLIDPLRIKENM